MSWMAYEQGMGYRCNDRASTEFRYDKYYYPDDAPFINYTDVSANRARCKAHLVRHQAAPASSASASSHAGFSWIAADDYYDGESAGNGDLHSREVQDGWLRRTITPILDSPAWRTQKSLLIITWDEAGVTGGPPSRATGWPPSWSARRARCGPAMSARSATTTTRPPGPSRTPWAWLRSPRTTRTPSPFNDVFTGGTADPAGRPSSCAARAGSAPAARWPPWPGRCARSPR